MGKPRWLVWTVAVVAASLLAIAVVAIVHPLPQRPTDGVGVSADDYDMGNGQDHWPLAP